MTKAQLLSVFIDEAGRFGGGLGVIVDEGRSISQARRKEITGQIGYDETIFVNNLQKNDVSVYTPQREVPFAGQPMLGTAWLLSQLHGETIQSLHCLGGDVDTWQSDGLTWIRAGLDIMPPWNIKQFAGPEEVERLEFSEADSLPHTLAWAWSDEVKGQVRARTFAVDWEIDYEVETNGSGSMLLAGLLQRDIQIKHGQGSMIYARPEDGDSAAIGGRVMRRELLEL